MDDDRIYGFGRNWYPPSPGNSHQMYLAGEKEIFFAATRDNTADTADAIAPKDKRRKKKPGAKAGHEGVRRERPGKIDERKSHRLKCCPHCSGRLRRCERARTRII